MVTQEGSLDFLTDDDRTRDDVRNMTRAEVLRAYDVRQSSRKDFLREWKKEHSGEGFHHRTHLGPTHRGKTTAELEILKQDIDPDRQAILLSAKPPHRDPVMNKAAEQLNLVVVEDYPPSAMARRYHKHRKKNGYVVRPAQTLTDLKADKEHVREVFSAWMLDAYSTREPVVIVCDEAHKIVNIYGLKDEYEAPLMSGLPDCAESSLIQRGRWMPYLAYDAPEDIIIFNDPDVSNQRRYSEIGGVNPAALVTIQSGLKTYKTKDGHTISEFLHVRRSGPRLTIVDIQ